MRGIDRHLLVLGIIVLFIGIALANNQLCAISAFLMFASWATKPKKQKRKSTNCVLCESCFNEYSRPLLICEDCATKILLERERSKKSFIRSAPTHSNARVRWYQ
ncbi:MAG: hypothetical protein COX44_01730 [Candidatus Portnoybacteria bacterium CG23_combo_of_CG06-09_8_20_14_all_37_13]|uniref:Uncharacterized protein n=1 Tax=Candidatus Portnoybacteria bacterium CG23_combo_of_CG06-09_8_20_14_all_37_13 TaxID=1974819 RepID=A0A2G9YD08_9BACT|nr:MAG: hypothetical protein COX44_01730 [Candidatus Portnoybacteria bacterium CG23_combo_of_CG06-09_8_20_14_all_37_13]